MQTMQQQAVPEDEYYTSITNKLGNKRTPFFTSESCLNSLDPQLTLERSVSELPKSPLELHSEGMLLDQTRDAGKCPIPSWLLMFYYK